MAPLLEKRETRSGSALFFLSFFSLVLLVLLVCLLVLLSFFFVVQLSSAHYSFIGSDRLTVYYFTDDNNILNILLSKG